MEILDPDFSMLIMYPQKFPDFFAVNNVPPRISDSQILSVNNVPLKLDTPCTAGARSTQDFVNSILNPTPLLPNPTWSQVIHHHDLRAMTCGYQKDEDLNTI